VSVKRTLCLLALALAACSSPAKKDPTGPGPTAKADDPTCPVLVAGTSVTVEDTERGAALVFVTTGDAPAVRVRASALANAHNEHHGKMGNPPAGGGEHKHGSVGAPMTELGIKAAAPPKPTMSMGTMISTHSTAEATDLPNGARVVFSAARDEDVAPLQKELRMHAGHLAHGTCEM
jgi:hypothetical protein